MTCRANTRNGLPCRRAVAEGELFCWQHAQGLAEIWYSLTRNQTIVFFMGIGGLLFGLVASILGGYWSYVSIQQNKPQHTLTSKPAALTYRVDEIDEIPKSGGVQRFVAYVTVRTDHPVNQPKLIIACDQPIIDFPGVVVAASGSPQLDQEQPVTFLSSEFTAEPTTCKTGGGITLNAVTNAANTKVEGSALVGYCPGGPVPNRNAMTFWIDRPNPINPDSTIEMTVRFANRPNSIEIYRIIEENPDKVIKLDQVRQ